MIRQTDRPRWPLLIAAVALLGLGLAHRNAGADCPPLPIPADPSPANGATTSCLLPELSWGDVTGATTYSVYLDGMHQAEVTSPTRSVGLSLTPGSHTWQVVAGNDCAVSTSPVWSFCLCDVPDYLYPTDGSTTNCLLSELAWTPSRCGTTVYEVVVDGLARGSVTGNTFPFSNWPGTHTWQLVVHGQCGPTTMPLATYCVLPIAPSTPIPPDGGHIICPANLLQWQSVCEALVYEVYIDGLPFAAVAQPWYQSQIPLPGGLHTWRVEVWSNCGTVPGPDWTFCHEPSLGLPLAPSDGSVVPCTVTELVWEGCAATTYTVYLDGAYAGTASDSHITLAVSPGLGDHTWSVTAANDCATTVGPNWTFRITSDLVPVAPRDGETTSCDLLYLDWSDACVTANRYDLFLDDGYVTSTLDSDYVLSSTLPGGQHTWRVDTVTSSGTTSGTTWRFCLVTAPVTATPSNCIVVPCGSSTFSWDPSCGALAYDVWVDRALVGTTTDTQYTMPIPPAPGLHAWTLVARGECGVATASSQWQFCVADSPTKPLSPVDGAYLCDAPQQLSWVPVCGAQNYLVWIDGTYRGFTAAPYWDIGTTVSLGWHEWHVDVQTLCQCAYWPPGPTWTFTVNGGSSLPNPNTWLCNGRVYCMTYDAASKSLLIGGEFTSVGPAASYNTQTDWVPRLNIAEIDLTSGTATGWNPGADGAVYSMLTSGTTLVIGGDFNHVAGIRRDRIAEVSRSTTSPVVMSWSPGSNGRVRALAVNAGQLLVGGEFTSIGGMPRSYAAGFDVLTGVPTPWNPSPNYYVYDIKCINSNAYVAGAFSTVGGTSRQGIAKISLSGNLDTVWDAQCDHYVYNMAYDANHNLLYVGGYFGSIGGSTRNNVAALNLTTALASPWNPNANGAVEAVAISSAVVYIGGHFSYVSGEPRPRFASLSNATGQPTGCMFPVDNVVRTLGQVPNALVLGGDFTYVGTTAIGGLGYFGNLLTGIRSGAEVNAWRNY